MNNSVIIKGNKYGIVVVLDDKIPFAQLREDIANKFKSATKFFDKANMAVSFEGRKLSSEEERDVLDIIAANSELNIVCVIDNNEIREQCFKKAVEERLEEGRRQYKAGNVTTFKTKEELNKFLDTL